MNNDFSDLLENQKKKSGEKIENLVTDARDFHSKQKDVSVGGSVGKKSVSANITIACGKK